MHLDIRVPMGVMFLLLGLVLAGYGLVSDAAQYARSLGQNLNLIWGSIFALFGASMLVLARISPSK